MSYHLSGLISSFFYGLTLIGLVTQLRFIWRRKQQPSELRLPGESPTASISLNFCLMAFLSFYLLFLYGFSLERFNHYLVWPRLCAMAISLLIITEIFRDRRDIFSRTALGFAVLSTVVGLSGLIFFRETAREYAYVSQFLIVIISIAMGQGNLHQLLLIYKRGITGGVSLRAHQLTFLKDLGSVAFGFAMGLESGWPLILLCGTNGVAKVLIMYSFYWVRTSPEALARRSQRT